MIGAHLKLVGPTPAHLNGGAEFAKARGHVIGVDRRWAAVPTAPCWGGLQRFLGTVETVMKYEKPAVQRFGTLREVTLGGGPQTQGDATNQFHRS